MIPHGYHTGYHTRVWEGYRLAVLRLGDPDVPAPCHHDLHFEPPPRCTNEVAAQLNLSIDDAQAIRPTDYMPLKPASKQIVYETEFHLFETPLQVSYDFRPTTLATETSYPIAKFNKIIDRRPNLQPPSTSHDLLSSSNAHLYGRHVNLFMMGKPSPSDGHVKNLEEDDGEDDEEADEQDEEEVEDVEVESASEQAWKKEDELVRQQLAQSGGRSSSTRRSLTTLHHRHHRHHPLRFWLGRRRYCAASIDVADCLPVRTISQALVRELKQAPSTPVPQLPTQPDALRTSRSTPGQEAKAADDHPGFEPQPTTPADRDRIGHPIQLRQHESSTPSAVLRLGPVQPEIYRPVLAVPDIWLSPIYPTRPTGSSAGMDIDGDLWIVKEVYANYFPTIPEQMITSQGLCMYGGIVGQLYCLPAPGTDLHSMGRD
eukprot:g81627.t1